jgi:hypothetical protein
MRKIVLALGGLFVAVAVVLLLRDAAEPLASLWQSIDANSLVGFGARVEKRISPALWSDVLVPVLTWPAWVLPLALGVLLVLAARPWHRLRDRRAARA